MGGSTAFLGQPSPVRVTVPPGDSYSIVTTDEQDAGREFARGCHGVSAPTAPRTPQGAQVSPEGNRLRAGLDSHKSVDIPMSSIGHVRNTE